MEESTVVMISKDEFVIRDMVDDSVFEEVEMYEMLLVPGVSDD